MGRTSVFLLNYHFVWCPKRRRKVLRGPVRERLIKLLQAKCAELRFDVIARFDVLIEVYCRSLKTAKLDNAWTR